jgi:hypothetical protein
LLLEDRIVSSEIISAVAGAENEETQLEKLEFRLLEFRLQPGLFDRRGD